MQRTSETSFCPKLTVNDELAAVMMSKRELYLEVVA